MPRKNPKGNNSSRGWKGRLGRKAKKNLYITGFERTEEKTPSLKPGDLIEVLVQSVNRRGEGEGVYEGRHVIIVGAADPGIKVMARVRKLSGGKIIAEIVDAQ